MTPTPTGRQRREPGDDDVRQPVHEPVVGRIAGFVVEDRHAPPCGRGAAALHRHAAAGQRQATAASAPRAASGRLATRRAGARRAAPRRRRPGGGAGRGALARSRSRTRPTPTPVPGTGSPASAASARTAGCRRCRRARCAPARCSRPGRGRSPRACRSPQIAVAHLVARHELARPGQQPRQRPRRLRLERTGRPSRVSSKEPLSKAKVPKV